MASVQNKNVRLSVFPRALTYCSSEVSLYGLCISRKDDVKKGDCSTEFAKLRNCFLKAVKELTVKK